jgi:hypothetical protein
MTDGPSTTCSSCGYSLRVLTCPECGGNPAEHVSGCYYCDGDGLVVEECPICFPAAESNWNEGEPETDEYVRACLDCDGVQILDPRYDGMRAILAQTASIIDLYEPFDATIEHRDDESHEPYLLVTPRMPNGALFGIEVRVDGYEAGEYFSARFTSEEREYAVNISREMFPGIHPLSVLRCRGAIIADLRVIDTVRIIATRIDPQSLARYAAADHLNGVVVTVESKWQRGGYYNCCCCEAGTRFDVRLPASVLKKAAPKLVAVRPTFDIIGNLQALESEMGQVLECVSVAESFSETLSAKFAPTDELFAEVNRIEKTSVYLAVWDKGYHFAIFVSAYRSKFRTAGIRQLRAVFPFGRTPREEIDDVLDQAQQALKHDANSEVSRLRVKVDWRPGEKYINLVQIIGPRRTPAPKPQQIEHGVSATVLGWSVGDGDDSGTDGGLWFEFDDPRVGTGIARLDPSWGYLVWEPRMTIVDAVRPFVQRGKSAVISLKEYKGEWSVEALHQIGRRDEYTEEATELG